MSGLNGDCLGRELRRVMCELMDKMMNITNNKTCHIDEKKLSLSISEVYKIDKRSNHLEINDYGKWRTDQNVTVTEKNIWKRRSNLKGTKIG